LCCGSLTSSAQQRRDSNHAFSHSGTAGRKVQPFVYLVRRRARPCRISLTDAQTGDELILVNYELVNYELVNYEHHAVASPYRMRFAIYVRRGEETFDAVDRVPEQLRKRMLAVRAL
jgi:hypothetical protein